MERITDEKKIRKVMDEYFEGAEDLHKGEPVRKFLPGLVESLDRPTDLQFLWDIKDFVSADDFTHAVRVAWDKESSESYREYDFAKEKVLEIFSACNPQGLMNDSDYEDYQALPDVITVYCGDFGMDDEEPSEILSWTTRLEIVLLNQDERFGGSVDSGGYTASIRKEDIIAYLPYNDNEVLLNPENLFDVERLNSFAPIFESTDFWDSFKAKCMKLGIYYRDNLYGKLMKKLNPLGRIDELIAATEDAEKLKALADEFGVSKWTWNGEM